MAQIFLYGGAIVGVVAIIGAIGYVRFARNWATNSDIQHLFGGID